MTALADAYQDLDDHLADQLPEEAYDDAPSDPGDVEAVNRQLRRLARHQRVRNQIVDVAEAEIARITEWVEARTSIIDKRIRWELDGLELYHRARLRDDPALKTISLPCGTLRSRVQQPAFDYDPDAFLPWAAEHLPAAVRTKVEVDRVEAKKALVVPALDVDETGPAVDGNGEVVPGVTVTARGPSFTVDVD